ncbi:selection and upkeep of intraepithelial T-cells protein 7-like [Pelmatolapia mariae]|uniref:selection and upkeep of intraepithelial T-cells protein 7-like n=1 Tax=Pelmatolapia mariae TaxID=158779 RepID=UPI002FE51FE7
MFPVTASLCSTLLFVGVFVFVSADQKNITAQSGQDVTLTCRAPSNKIIVVKWIISDLQKEYVVLYRDGQFDPENQHPSFKNRVDLQDRQMKDGDVSLILKDVTINDTGTYECRVVQAVRQPMKLISSIYLHVVPPGQTGGDTEDGSVGLIVGLSVSAVLLVAAAVGFWIFIKYKQRQCRDSFQHPSEIQQL